MATSWRRLDTLTNTPRLNSKSRVKNLRESFDEVNPLVLEFPCLTGNELVLSPLRATDGYAILSLSVPSVTRMNLNGER